VSDERRIHTRSYIYIYIGTSGGIVYGESVLAVARPDVRLLYIMGPRRGTVYIIIGTTTQNRDVDNCKIRVRSIIVIIIHGAQRVCAACYYVTQHV